MPEAKGGHNLFGHAVGIIMLDTRFARIPGDIGNAGTWDFPVLYRIVEDATPLRVVRKKAEGLLVPFLAAAQGLASQGVRAITTSCGFLAVYQGQIASQVPVPVYTSSLLQIPLVQRMVGPNRKVGVITVDSRFLTQELLGQVGAADVPLVVEGTEGGEELTRVLIDGKEDLDVAKAERDVVGAARRLVQRDRDVGAIVLECTNMPPYSRSVQRATGLPVFDIVTLTRCVYGALQPPAFMERSF